MTYSPGDFHEACIVMSQQIGAQATAQAALPLLAAAAQTHIRTADAAAVTVLATRAPASATAATSGLGGAIEVLQHQFEGPHIDAASETAGQVSVQDLTSETRWPQFTAAALARTEVRSMLSTCVSLDADKPYATLNLYSRTPYAFDENAARIAGLLVAHAAPALALARERYRNTHLERALESSRTIGTAMGVLMTRHLITIDEAFDLLCTASQRSNRKLRDIALDVTETGTLVIPSVAGSPTFDGTVRDGTAARPQQAPRTGAAT